MMRKKLGKEYMNTILMSFKEDPSPRRLLMKLKELNMLSDSYVRGFWEIEELNVSDPCFKALTFVMNRIAPAGCKFEARYNEDDIEIGFFAEKQMG